MTATDESQGHEPRPRTRRADGERSRTAILREAARLATVEGIDGLSIGRLAQAVGMSKSGLFAHFGSKEELQLATIETAEELYDEEVVRPALGAATGLERLQQLTDNFLRHVESGVYPGGCFFASVAAELDAQRGPVRDRAMAFLAGWNDHLEGAARDAQREGAIDPARDPVQLTFELVSFMFTANLLYVITGSTTPLQRARAAIRSALGRAQPMDASGRA